MTFTPGPWAIDDDAVGADFYIMAEGDIVVAEVDESEANAALIAAAPELFEALEETLDALEEDGWFQDGAVINKALAALAKARGQSSEIIGNGGRG